ncbi:aerotolerance regulator BatC, partial [Streptomyces sp. SID5770]|nr:aerotolerance regulator BatC [Streptomyces sp. SID5770]
MRGIDEGPDGGRHDGPFDGGSGDGRSGGPVGTPFDGSFGDSFDGFGDHPSGGGDRLAAGR